MTEKKLEEYKKWLEVIKLSGGRDYIYKQIIEDIQHLYAMDYIEKNGTLKGSWIEDMPDSEEENP